MARRGLFDGVLIIGHAADAHSGLSDGSLKACLAAEFDRCRGKARKKCREGKMRGRERSKGEMMKEGALGVLVILIHSTPYTLKSVAALPK